MALAPGAKLGPYEILGPIGAGGMGEVYKARDPRIGRDVAIKVLPAGMSSDPDRLRRFEQEVRAVGALNHPNVLSIYDVGTQDGSPYIVSELLEGETLRERQGGAALAQRKAIDYAQQAARGLAAAHAKGIVHRDLKPENLFITRDGRVKILDFGLAKLTQAEPADPSKTRTTLDPRTEPGVVLGTMGYMSPEQVRGETADHRSDIFTFGSILYEMLTGRRAFQGQSSVEAMHAILKDEPPEISVTNQNIPAALERIVRRCLEKSPEERFQSASDLAFALEALSSSAPVVTAPAIAPRRALRRLAMPLAVAAVVALVAAAFVIGRRTAAKPTAPTFRRLTFRNGSLSSARFAPDGQTVIYSASWDGKPSQIFSARPGNPESRSLGLPAAQLFDVSSSGDMALSLDRGSQGRTLARVPLAGGAPRELLEDVKVAAWAPDGTLAVIRRAGRQERLEFPIGKTLYQAFNALDGLRFSPKGDHIAFKESNAGRASVTLMDLAGKRRTVSSGWKGVGDVMWSASGDEVWFSATESGFSYAVYAVNVSGAPAVRLVLRMAGSAVLQDLARDGRALVTHDNLRTAMICLPPGETKERDLAWLDADVPVALSNDGKTLLFHEVGEASGATYPVYMRRTDGTDAVHLGEGPALALSPDGKWVITIHVPNVSELILLPTGAGEPRTLKNDVIKFYASAAWFPDGKRIVATGAEDENHTSRSWVLDPAGGKPRPITPEGVLGLLVSPDGKFLLAADASQKRALYPIEGGEPRPVAGFEPGDGAIRWSADGRSVFVRQRAELRTKIFLLDIATGRRQLWKELAIPEPAGADGIRNVLLTPDGKSYVYWYVRDLTDLYLVEGLK